MIPYFESLTDAVRSAAGTKAEIRSAVPVSGGDINQSYRLVLTDGSSLFLKANGAADASFFQAESDGICAIASTKTINVPEVLARGHESTHGGYEFLLMSFLESRNAAGNYWEVLGTQLAAMHSADTGAFADGGMFGFYENNFIGRTVQVNTLHKSWVSFFRDARLIPQARMAERYFDHGSRKKMTRLLDHLEDYLVEPEHPSLVHGDLWSGNVMPGNDGYACLIDPAVYVGHAEADLAMTELFGGFPVSFYRAYQEASPLQSGYRDRRDIYNLYHLLNHTNLFGWGYFASVEQILDRF